MSDPLASRIPLRDDGYPVESAVLISSWKRDDQFLTAMHHVKIPGITDMSLSRYLHGPQQHNVLFTASALSENGNYMNLSSDTIYRLLFNEFMSEHVKHGGSLWLEDLRKETNFRQLLRTFSASYPGAIPVFHMTADNRIWAVFVPSPVTTYRD